MSFDSDSTLFSRDDYDYDAGYVPHLEKDYCSNFVCCGVTLADLHELVSHFEERHVTVVSSDGALLPPISPESLSDASSPQTACSSALASPRSSYTATPPPTNLFPTLTSAFTPRESAFTPVTTSSSRDPGYQHSRPYLAKEEQIVFDTMLHSSVYDSNTAPAPLQPHPRIYVPPAQFFPGPGREPSVVPSETTLTAYPTQTQTHVYPPTIAPTPVYARHPNLSIITDLPPEPQPSSKRKTDSSISDSEDAESLPPARRRKKPNVTRQPVREKTHKCPHAGCIKSYLNQNGLKYHLTKGACDFGPASS